MKKVANQEIRVVDDVAVCTKRYISHESALGDANAHAASAKVFKYTGLDGVVEGSLIQPNGVAS